MQHLSLDTYSPSDEQLLKDLRSGSLVAVRRLYGLHYPSVRAYVLQNNGAESDAQDVFQEAVTALWLNLKEGRYQQLEGAGPGAYLFRIAKNKWLDTVRSASFKHRSTMHVEHIDVVQEEDELVEARLEHLRNIYEQLDERCRTVLDLFYFAKQDLETIAGQLGVDVGSIRTIKYRCMMKLRKYHVDRQEGRSLEDR